MTSSPSIHQLLHGSEADTPTLPNTLSHASSTCIAIALYYTCGCKREEPVFFCQPYDTQETYFEVCQHKSPMLVVGTLPFACQQPRKTGMCLFEDPARKQFVREADTADRLEDLVIVGKCSQAELGVILPSQLGELVGRLQDAIGAQYQKQKSPERRKTRLNAAAFDFRPMASSASTMAAAATPSQEQEAQSKCLSATTETDTTDSSEVQAGEAATIMNKRTRDVEVATPVVQEASGVEAAAPEDQVDDDVPAVTLVVKRTEEIFDYLQSVERQRNENTAIWKALSAIMLQ